MARTPATQYSDDRNLRARQRLWGHQRPSVDLVKWVLDLAGVRAGQRALDVGCGNGTYVRELARRRVSPVGCDLSLGMLQAAAVPALVNADAVALPFGDGCFDTVLAPHMLYHVPDRAAAARELRRVVGDGGTCVAVTNGAGHLRPLRDLVEEACRQSDSGWEMRNPSTHDFSLENGEEQLATAFDSVTTVRLDAGPAVLHDAGVAADYVASVADHYEGEISRPWAEVVAWVRTQVDREIAVHGSFAVHSAVGAFVCR